MLGSSEPRLDAAEVDTDGYGSSSLKGDAMRKGINPNRSKHSETEQRRRSKINGRFHILRGLIPENDSKRDKASFLLEVIEHIKLLQAKLQIYEGSCQEWNQEHQKFPWSYVPSASENISEQSPIVKACSIVESAAEHPFVSSIGTSISETQPTEAQAQHCSISGNCSDSNVHEVNGAADLSSISSAYNQRVLNTITQSLESSGVDLSLANLSVEFDIRKRVHDHEQKGLKRQKI